MDFSLQSLPPKMHSELITGKKKKKGNPSQTLSPKVTSQTLELTAGPMALFFTVRQQLLFQKLEVALFITVETERIHVSIFISHSSWRAGTLSGSGAAIVMKY